MGILDRISPTWAANRAKARLELEKVAARTRVLREVLAYEGASRGRRSARWHRHGASSPAQSMRGALQTLRDRSRQLVQNNEQAVAGVELLESEIIGTGIIAQALPASREQRDIDNAQRAMDLWREHFETTKCDAAGESTFYGLQCLATRSMVEGGAGVIRRRIRRASDNLPLPMQLQLLEPDHIDLLKDGPLEAQGDRRRGQIVQGVEFDAIGRRSGYWLYPNHPGDHLLTRTLQSNRVPASEILHMREVLRVGQVHGVPWLAPVIVRIGEWNDYTDAQLVRQKIAAMFAGFERDLDPEVTAARTVAGPDADASADPPVDSLEPGIWAQLGPGRDIVFSDPPQVGEIADFAKVTLRSIAAGLRVTYEGLTGDYSSVNFSSGRMGRLQFQRSVRRWRGKTIVPQLCDPVWDWFMTMAVDVMGLLPERVGVQWTPPAPEFIDPRVEVRALTQQIRSGFLSLDQVIRQYGHDPRTFLQRRQMVDQDLDELGIVLDSDPRQDAGRKGGPDGGSAEMSAEQLRAMVRDSLLDDDSLRLELDSKPELAARFDTALDEFATAAEERLRGISGKPKRVNGHA